MSVLRPSLRAAVTVVIALALGCTTDTSRLTPEQETRFAGEGIQFKADNLTFRYSHDGGTRDAGWEDRRASIVVTGHSVLIHKNEKIGIEIDPAARRFYEVHRDRDRIRIGAGSGRSREAWSFVPPGDPEAWTEAIRAVIKASNSVANR